MRAQPRATYSENLSTEFVHVKEEKINFFSFSNFRLSSFAIWFFGLAYLIGLILLVSFSIYSLPVPEPIDALGTICYSENFRSQ